jgi:hypothetical protein
MEERYCTECRALIPEKETVCPACGVFAGDVFDGKLPRKKRSHAWWVVPLLMLGALVAFILMREPVHVIPANRVHLVRRLRLPLSQTDAMTALRSFLTTSDRSERCVALIAKRKTGDQYVIAAVDSCKHVKLGDFAVDAKNAHITKR